MTLRVSPPIDLEATLDGGQAFRWWREGDGYRGVIGRQAYRLSEQPSTGLASERFRDLGGDHGMSGPEEAARAANEVRVEAVDGAPLNDFDRLSVHRYLGLGYDFAGFVARFAADPCIGPALTGWPGLRVLRQDRWECLVAFICSSTSNIPRIKQNVTTIAVTLGDRVGPGPHDFAFPSPARLAAEGEAALRRLGLGFRAKSVARAAEAVSSGGLDLEAVARKPYGEALESLVALYGVGEKVADCALAFAFDMPEAFPVDRWVKRALEEWYGLPGELSITKSAVWARERFGRDAAYVNQYLFHRQRLSARRVAPTEVVVAGGH